MIKFLKIPFIIIIFIKALPGYTENKPKIIASFSILGDFVHTIGGDKIELVTVVGADQDAHIYRPSPDLSKKLKDVKIVFLNGIGFDSWLNPYLEAANYKGKIIIASSGIDPLYIFDASGKKILDPHTWLTVKQVKVYIKNIYESLIALLPQHKAYFSVNYQKYVRQLNLLDHEIHTLFNKIPIDKRKVITAHDAFTSFGREYGLIFLSPQGLSTESEAKPKDVAKLIDQIKEEKIKAVFVENITNERLLRQIADESGAQIGGTLYSDALSEKTGPAPNYIELMRHNTKLIAAALN